MAVCAHHAFVILTLLFTWFQATKARTVSDILEDRVEKEFPLDLNDRKRFVPSEEMISSLSFDRPYRSARKIMRPRTTRIGENLFTARGYGKRSSKTEMALLSARRFGKRNEEKNNSLLCMITKCKNYSSTVNIDEDVFSILERRDKKLPEETTLDED